MVKVHDFGKYVFDLVLTVFWIWVPMFYLNLKDSPYAPVIWIVDIGLLATIIYLLHRKAGNHKI